MAGNHYYEHNDREYVTMSNQLSQAVYRLSLSEHRLIRTAIAAVHRDDKSLDDYIVVRAEDYADVSNIPLTEAYRDMETAVERLWDRELTIHEPPRGKTFDDPVDYPMHARWLVRRSAARYNKRQGRCGIRFSSEIAPYIVDLGQGEFLKYRLDYVGPMRSQYGPRLYELLMQWYPRKQKLTYSIDWLRKTWQVRPDMRIDNFKSSVINAALRAVNDHTDVNVTAEYSKSGKRVSHVTFYLQAKPESKPKGDKPKSNDWHSHEQHKAPERTQAVIDRERAAFGVAVEDFDSDTGTETDQVVVETGGNEPASQADQERQEKQESESKKNIDDEKIRALRRASRRRNKHSPVP